MKLKKFGGSSWKLVKQTYFEFENNNAIKLRDSLSYYTLFSLPPLLIILLSIFSFFFGRDPVTGRFFCQINRMVGDKVVVQIQETIKNIELSDSNTIAEIQSAIYFIWGLKAKPYKGIMKFITNR